MNRNGPTPSSPSTYLVTPKFAPQTNMIAIAAASAAREWRSCRPRASESGVMRRRRVHYPVLAARPSIRSLAPSRIRELFNEGLGRDDLLQFWVGEPDEPTPDFIRRAGMDSLAAGETFYTHNLGIPELRDALSKYLSRLHRPVAPEEIAVTSSGVNALMLASQLLVDPGERVVEVVPLWPNLQEIPKILGAQVETVALEFAPGGWRLDLDRLLDALAPGTRAVYLNSPNNPTGWTITRDEQRALLAHCRRHGIWIFADDAYERLYFDAGGVAPSFLDICEAQDRVISTNTFSKSWLMTGWRLGYLVCPPHLAAIAATLQEPITSCASSLIQKGGEVALGGPQECVDRFRTLYRERRDVVVEVLGPTGLLPVVPAGAFYALVDIGRSGQDSMSFAKSLLLAEGVAVVPGVTFGPSSDRFVRIAYTAADRDLRTGLERLRRYLLG